MRNRKKFVSWKVLQKGSITLEATLVIPVFLFAMIALMYFFQIMFIQEKVSQGLWETAREASRYSCIYKDIGGGEKKEEDTNSKAIAKKWMDGALTGVRMGEYLPEDILDNSCIKGGSSGILYKSSILEKNEEIALTAIYQVEFPIMTNLLPTMNFVQQTKSRGFVGTNKIGLSKKEMEEQDIYVYVTKTGTVYHTTLTCSHINLGIACVTYNQAKEARNTGGGKYKSCQKCTKSSKVLDSSIVYITETGDRYHTNVECSGLIRDVRKVKLSELNGIGACQRCG